MKLKLKDFMLNRRLRFGLSVLTLFIPCEEENLWLLDTNYTKNYDGIKMSSMQNTALGYPCGRENEDREQSFTTGEYHMFVYKMAPAEQKANDTAVLHGVYLSPNGKQQHKKYVRICGTKEDEEFLEWYRVHEEALNMDLVTERNIELFREDMGLRDVLYDEGTPLFKMYADLVRDFQASILWRVDPIEAKCRLISLFHILCFSPLDFVNQGGYRVGDLTHECFRKSGLLDTNGFNTEEKNLRAAYDGMIESEGAVIKQSVDVNVYVTAEPYSGPVDWVISCLQDISRSIAKEKVESSNRSLLEAIERMFHVVEELMNDDAAVDERNQVANRHAGVLDPKKNDKIWRAPPTKLGTKKQKGRTAPGIFVTPDWDEYLAHPTRDSLETFCSALYDKLGLKPPIILTPENMINDNSLSPKEFRGKILGGNLDPNEWSFIALLPFINVEIFEACFDEEWTANIPKHKALTEHMIYAFGLSVAKIGKPGTKQFGITKDMNLYQRDNYPYAASLFIYRVFEYCLAFNDFSSAEEAFRVLDVGENAMKEPEAICRTLAHMYLHLERIVHIIATYLYDNLSGNKKACRRSVIEWLVRINVMRDVLSFLKMVGFTPELCDPVAGGGGLDPSKYSQLRKLLSEMDIRATSKESQDIFRAALSGFKDAKRSAEWKDFYTQHYMLEHGDGNDCSKATDLFFLLFTAYLETQIINSGANVLSRELLVLDKCTAGNRRMTFGFRDDNGAVSRSDDFKDWALDCPDRWIRLDDLGIQMFRRPFTINSYPAVLADSAWQQKAANFDFNPLHPPASRRTPVHNSNSNCGGANRGKVFSRVLSCVGRNPNQHTAASNDESGNDIDSGSARKSVRPENSPVVGSVTGSVLGDGLDWLDKEKKLLMPELPEVPELPPPEPEEAMRSDLPPAAEDDVSKADLIFGKDFNPARNSLSSWETNMESLPRANDFRGNGSTATSSTKELSDHESLLVDVNEVYFELKMLRNQICNHTEAYDYDNAVWRFNHMLHTLLPWIPGEMEKWDAANAPNVAILPEQNLPKTMTKKRPRDSNDDFSITSSHRRGQKCRKVSIDEFTSN